MRETVLIGLHGMESPCLLGLWCISTHSTISHWKHCSKSNFSLDFCLNQVSIGDAKAEEYKVGNHFKVLPEISCRISGETCVTS